MIKGTQKLLALALGSVLTVSSLAIFAGCGGDGGSATKAEGARIAFDNLPDDGVELPASTTSYTLKGAVSRKEYDATGAEVAEGTVVDYAGGVVSAKNTAGSAVFTMKDGTGFRVEVVPAYVTNPHNQYDLSSKNDYSTGGSKLLGWTHDPSLIEVEENGKPAYYIFSTGWSSGNEIRKSYDLITWNYLGKATSPSTQMPLIDAWEEEKNSTSGGIQWWAPDIVKAPDGGYWLYTCCVSNGTPNHDGVEYSKACIVLFHSYSLQPETFQYVGVLMQSAIPQNTQESSMDVNSIDPQIIYSPDGKMYMAYGSFGTGNWMLELDPATGLRKDNFYQDGTFLDIPAVRAYRDEAVAMHMDFAQGKTVESEFYGRLISLSAMEAPVIARHDNVTIMDENEKVLSKGKTYYYSMHSYNGLDVGYQMWGGRSESPWGVYESTNGGIVRNIGPANAQNSGNKYTGTFKWQGAWENAIDIKLPGHNDLFTTKSGVNVAAYITRTDSWMQKGQADGTVFVSQVHQYYLNSMGDIVINPNRYGGESQRPVSEEELFKYTQDRKFKMVVLKNDNDLTLTSTDVTLREDGTIWDTMEIGTWRIYGDGYIYFEFNDAATVPAGHKKYYGVVRTAWLDDQNKSGFTITCMSHSEGESTQGFGLFFNNYSSITGTDLVG